MDTKFDIYVYIEYCLDIENEWQVHHMTCDAPGVVFLPHKCSFLSYETKVKPFRSSMVLIQEGKVSVSYLISCISIYIEENMII